MCGIAGAFGHGSAAGGFERIFRAIAHRGPDASGAFRHGEFQLGMHRLRFRGAPRELPVREAGAVSAYNGQVYGWIDSAGACTRVPEGLSSEIATASSRAGADGMFAYARYSLEERRALLATDRHFVKPLFYRRKPHSVSFCSELAPLLAGGAALDADALAELFAYGWYLSDQSCAVDVSLVWKHDVELDAMGVKLLRKRSELGPPGDRPTAAALRRAIRASVARSAEGAGPLGLALSGGLDSSTLAWELNAIGVEDLVCVTVRGSDGSDGIESLAELGLPPGEAWTRWKHVVVELDDREFLRAFERSARSFGQPTTMSSLPLYQSLAEAASAQGVRALLLGEGVDEYFAGYASYAKVEGLGDPLDYYRHPARERAVALLFGRAGLERVQRRFRQTYPACADLRAVEVDLRLTRLLLRSDVSLMSRSIEGRVPFLHGGIPELALGLSRSEIAAPPGKLALRAAYADALGPRATARKVRFKASNPALLRCLELDRLGARIEASCGRVFGSAAVRRALDALHTPAGFNADVLCLLFSLTFLIEGGLLHGDARIPTSSCEPRA